jgi:hypothetical protein
MSSGKDLRKPSDEPVHTHHYVFLAQGAIGDAEITGVV